MRRGGILVVDDEETVRLTLTAILTQDGYQVTPAPSGADALVLLNGAEFDVVLTDLRMDDVDGLQVLAGVRRRWPDTVTLMLTGYASLDSAVAAMRAGAYDYLCKPCPVDEILATVARAMERRRLVQDVRRNVRHLEVSIDTARELHSSLQTQVEGTRALLRERERLLESLGVELRSSLLSIAGLADVMLSRVQPSNSDPPGAVLEFADAQELVGYLQQIRAESERLVELVQDTVQPRTDEPDELVHIANDAVPVTQRQRI